MEPPEIPVFLREAIQARVKSYGTWCFVEGFLLGFSISLAYSALILHATCKN